jgi:hypothetical protein
LNGQQEKFRRQATIAKLRGIGVLLPTHATEQIPITQVKRNEIAAAAMIWTDYQFSRL